VTELYAFAGRPSWSPGRNAPLVGSIRVDRRFAVSALAWLIIVLVVVLLVVLIGVFVQRRRRAGGVIATRRKK
jgi:hypothetical protein